MRGETWHNGVLGAAAGGAAGAILSSTGDVVTASYASARVESVVNEVASYIPGVCTFNGQEQKELTVKNVPGLLTALISSARNAAIFSMSGNHLLIERRLS